MLARYHVQSVQVQGESHAHRHQHAGGQDPLSRLVAALAGEEIVIAHRVAPIQQATARSPGFTKGKFQEHFHVVENYVEILHRPGALELPVSATQAAFASKTGWPRHDSFDRIFASRAVLENLTLISNDTALPWLTAPW
ncbi:MAG: hypothetical protein LBJ76_05025 [Candidatus Accumulibacter sp.]|nr:hypothetical protein [Accumulibacter sp.]